MKKDKIGTCTYCGRNRPLTLDHVPPKNLFPKPRPQNLITVPSCEECNLGDSDEDEYLRLVLSLREDVSQNPAVIAVRLASLRSAKYRNVLAKTLKTRTLYGPDGKVASQSQDYDVKLAPLTRVVARTTAGLMLYLLKRRIPEAYSVGVQLATEISFERDVDLAELREFLRSRNPAVQYPHVYEVRVVPDTEDPGITIWWHTFYEKVEFLAATLPPRESP